MGKNRAHICHLTVLNPAVHSRIFFKEAVSQVEAGYRVSIIGQDSASAPYEREGVQIIPTGVFGRRSRRRWNARRQVLQLARKTDADLFQIHTPELLGVAKILKAENPRKRLIYDVHEDYASNILHGSGYPTWSRKYLARRVRQSENEFAGFGDGLIYAEDAYQGLINMPRERTAFVRNKFMPPLSAASSNRPQQPYMLYCGTISRLWGVERSIELWRELNELEPLDLVIAGHTHDKQLLQEIRELTEDESSESTVHIYGGHQYLPYEHIVHLIKGATFGTAFYDPVPHIRKKIPTKFYEFMGLRTPLLFTENPTWDQLNQELDFGLSLPFPLDSRTIQQVQEEVVQERRSFFKRPLTDADWSWSSEKQGLVELVEKVLAE